MERIVLPRHRMLGVSTRNANVISSRVCIARNIDALAFPFKLSSNERSLLENHLQVLLQEIEPNIISCNIKTLTPTQKLQLKSDLIITNHFLESGETYFAKNDGSWIILPNEKDHIHIFSIDYGHSLKEIYKRLTSILLALDPHIHYAYSSEFGFTTSEINYTGNGLYLSLLINLIGLEIQGVIPDIMNICEEMGYRLSSYDGQNHCGLYFLQNIGSFGISEQDHIEHITQTLQKIQNHEHLARKELLDDNESVEMTVTQITQLLKQPELNYRDCLHTITMVELLYKKVYNISNRQLWQEQIFRLHNHSSIFTHISNFEECNHYRSKLLNQIFSQIIRLK